MPAALSRLPSAVWLAQAGFLAVLVFWSLLTPAYRAADEPQHVSAVLGLVDGEGWPRPADAQTDPGVLGSAVQAGLLTSDPPRGRTVLPGQHVATGRVDPLLYSEVPPSRPQERLPYSEFPGPGGPGQVNQMTQHPPAYYGAQAAVVSTFGASDWRWDRQLQLMRLVSVAMVGALPILAFVAARRLSGSDTVGGIAAFLPLAVPQLAHVGSSVTNDALVVLAGAVLVVALVHVLTGVTSWRWLATCSVALGVGLLTKGLVVPLVPAVALALLIGLRRSGLRWFPAGLRTLVVLTGAFVLGGWWWLLNLVRYGTLQPNGYGVDRPYFGPPVDVVSYAGRFLREVNTSFWGNFGWLELPLPGLVTTALAVATLVMGGVAVADRATRVPMLVLALLGLFSLAALFVTLYQVHLRDGRFVGTQGRYLFAALLVFVLTVAVGFATSARWARLPERWMVPVVAVGSAVTAGYGGWSAFRGFYLDNGEDVGSAWARMLAWAPWPGWLVSALLASTLILLAAGPVSAMLSALRRTTVQTGGSR